MAKFKDFTPKVDKTEEKPEPIGFSLYGEDFECSPVKFQAYKLVEFVHEANSKDSSKSTGAIIKFFSYVLNEEDHKRLVDILESPDKIVEMEQLMEIVNYIIEEYSDLNPKS